MEDGNIKQFLKFKVSGDKGVGALSRTTSSAQIEPLHILIVQERLAGTGEPVFA